MRVGVLGINYKSSNLGLREVLAKACQRSFGNDSEPASRLSCVLLSTCNRTEIYFSAEDLTSAHSEILQILRVEIEEPFEHKLYSYFGEDCFNHLAIVTAGLDSVVIAETDIQRQVKVAYENAILHRELPSCMHFLFQKSFKIGKSIRTTFPPIRGLPNLEGVIFYVSQEVFKQSKEMSVLFIGNSEINRKILHYFKNKKIDQISLCTRSMHSAKELTREHNIQLIDWSKLELWQDFDLVICGTNQHDFLLKPEQIATNQPKTTLILDLSVPRNVDPRLGRHPELILLNMEELGAIIEKRRKGRLHELQEAERMIRESVDRHLFLYQAKSNKAMACV